MKLKKFNKNNKRNTMIIIAIVLIVGLVVSTNLIKSHAYFKTSKSFNVIQGKIPNKNNGDVRLAVFIGDQKVDTFPDKKNHKYVETVCNEDSHANISFDPNTWKLNIDGIDSKTICTIKFETKTNLDLDGSEPVIKDGLLPVVIADNGVVTKTTKDNLNWYDYNNSKWANAVILTGTDTYQIGDPIPEEAIESYFVWIPKYRYKLFNVEGNEISPQEIDIQIGDYDTENNNTTECKATNISGDNGTCKNDMWMTHPAFTSLGVNGLWIGKFETGYKGSNDLTSATKDENNPEKVQIKPNVNNWIITTGSNAYNNSFNYKRNLDSHMMKNTEWGAMIYFTNSKYGLFQVNLTDNRVYSSSNKNGITGCGVDNFNDCVSVIETCLNQYGTKNNGEYRQSTTHNISGIFGTVGGSSWELVMGNSKNLAGNSELNLYNIPSKYKDVYYGVTQEYKILGDTIAEAYKWSTFSTLWEEQNDVFYVRGVCDENTGNRPLFSYYRHSAGKSWSLNYRIALSPSN